MRPAGRTAWQVLQTLLDAARPGVTTAELDALARAELQALGASPLFLNYRQVQSPPFPACICVSINEEAAHGVPGPRILRPGDLISIDLGLGLAGWCADAARSAVVGGDDVSPASAAVAGAAASAVQAGIRAIGPGVLWSEIVAAVRRSASSSGFSLVRGVPGHGIGRLLHEPPEASLDLTPPDQPDGAPTNPKLHRTAAIPDWASRPPDFTLRPGMVLTIEPILTPGSGRLVGLDDGWTVLTADRQPAAQEERTVAVTRSGPLVLTAA
jgi:methionyl aminopeptidase